MEYIIGADIKCYYNGRKLKGKVVRNEPKFIVVSLYTPYQGKNEFWDIGELKVLYKKIITTK